MKKFKNKDNGLIYTANTEFMIEVFSRDVKFEEIKEKETKVKEVKEVKEIKQSKEDFE